MKKTRPLTIEFCGLLNVFQIHCSALMMSARMNVIKVFEKLSFVVVSVVGEYTRREYTFKHQQQRRALKRSIQQQRQ